MTPENRQKEGAHPKRPRARRNGVAAALQPPSAPPENRRKTGSEAPARRRGNGTFGQGVSGNPGGRPKGAKTYNVRRLWGDALDDPATRPRVVEALRGAVTHRRTVVQSLESAARINKEIGLGSEQAGGGVVITVYTNIEPGSLR